MLPNVHRVWVKTGNPKSPYSGSNAEDFPHTRKGGNMYIKGHFPTDATALFIIEMWGVIQNMGSDRMCGSEVWRLGSWRRG